MKEIKKVWEGLSQTIEETINNVSEKGSKFIEKTADAISDWESLAEEEASLEELYLELGKKAYNAYANDEVLRDDEQIFVEIEATKSLIKNLKKNAEERKAAGRCRQCGEKIKKNAAFCPHCGKSQEESIGYCPHCGADVDIDDNFCHECGRKIC